MKKIITLSIIALGLIGASQIDAQNAPTQQEPPAEVKKYYTDYAKAIDALTEKAKQTPELKDALADLNNARTRLDAEMKKNKDSKLQQPPQSAQNLMKANQEALKKFIQKAKTVPATQALAQTVEDIDKKAQEALNKAAQEAQKNNKPATSNSTVRKARKIVS